MRIQFNPNLDYQREAIDSIVDIFVGQEICQTNFTVAPLRKEDGFLPGLDRNDLGIGNRLRLLDEDILNNVKAIQLRNGLASSDELDGMNFTVETLHPRARAAAPRGIKFPISNSHPSPRTSATRNSAFNMGVNDRIRLELFFVAGLSRMMLILCKHIFRAVAIGLCDHPPGLERESMYTSPRRWTAYAVTRAKVRSPVLDFARPRK